MALLPTRLFWVEVSNVLRATRHGSAAGAEGGHLNRVNHQKVDFRTVQTHFLSLSKFIKHIFFHHETVFFWGLQLFPVGDPSITRQISTFDHPKWKAYPSKTGYAWQRVDDMDMHPAKQLRCHDSSNLPRSQQKLASNFTSTISINIHQSMKISDSSWLWASQAAMWCAYCVTAFPTPFFLRTALTERDPSISINIHQSISMNIHQSISIHTIPISW